MAFPTTGLLSSFTGVDESPLSEGGNWLGPVAPGETRMRRVSNAAKAVGASGSAYWSGISSADLEAYIDVPTLPSAGAGAIVYLRLQNPNTGTATCYIWVYIQGTGFQWYKLTGGSSFTQLGTTFTTHTLAAGESIGASVIGNVLSGYWGATGMISPVLVDSRTDNTIAGAGQIGFGCDESVTTILDNFGGGITVAGGVTTRKMSTMGIG